MQDLESLKSEIAAAVAAAATPEALEEVRVGALGRKGRVTELMKGYMREAGATSFMTQMRIGGLEHKKVMRSMELFARDVMPELRKEEEKMAVLV